MSNAFENRRPRNLIWLPNVAGALTTMFHGAVLTVDQRSLNQWPWVVTVDGYAVSEGVSPTLDHAREAAMDVAASLAVGG